MMLHMHQRTAALSAMLRVCVHLQVLQALLVASMLLVAVICWTLSLHMQVTRGRAWGTAYKSVAVCHILVVCAVA